MEGPGTASNKVEYRFRHADGSWRWVESVGTYLVDDPAVEGVVVNVRDITERKRAQTALQESEQRLRTVAAGAPVIMFAIDPEGTFTFEGGAALKDLGLEPGANVGRSVFETYASLPKVLDNVRRALAGEHVVDTVRIDSRAYHATYSPQRDEHGNVSGIIGVATDVSERWKLERELEHLATHDPLPGWLIVGSSLCVSPKPWSAPNGGTNPFACCSSTSMASKKSTTDPDTRLGTR